MFVGDYSDSCELTNAKRSWGGLFFVKVRDVTTRLINTTKRKKPPHCCRGFHLNVGGADLLLSRNEPTPPTARQAAFFLKESKSSMDEANAEDCLEQSRSN